jgi:hypothetical protein
VSMIHPSILVDFSDNLVSLHERCNADTQIEMFLWSDDIGDANGESVQYSNNVYDTITRDYPHPHLVLDHSVIQTSK